MSQACDNDKQEIVPALAAISDLPEALGQVEALLTDAGYFSEYNLAACATPIEQMRHKLRTVSGRAVYARRKCTVEPVFGIIKHVLGFRQFFLRGLGTVTGEWTLVSIAWNLKRMFALHN